jgi:hypothetical protein
MLNPVLNLIQYRFSIPACGRQVIESNGYETLKSETLNLIQGRVQKGDKITITTGFLEGEGFQKLVD